MGRRGPPPLPAALRKLRGRAHRKKENSKATEVRVGAPAMPPHIKEDPIARQLWLRLCDDLTELKVLAPQYGIMLAAICMAYSRARGADDMVRKHGLFIMRRGKPVTNPAVRISQNAWRDVRVFAQEFGLTPSAATRVRPSPTVDAGQQNAEASAETFLFGRSSKVVGQIGPKAQD